MSASQIDRLLDDHDFRLIRTKKHQVWGHDDGRRFVRPSTPSDSRHGDKNSLSDLCRMLGIKKSSLRERPRRVPDSDSPVSPEIVLVHPPIPIAPIELPAELVATLPPLTAKEQKMLRRWERNHKQKSAKREKIIERLQWAVMRTHEAIFEDECGLPLQMSGEWLLENLRRHEGFGNTNLVTAMLHVTSLGADDWTEFKMVSAFGFVLDPISSKLRTTQQWTDEFGGEEIEVVIMESEFKTEG